MALTTYAQLQTTIADFLNREDLTSIVPTFIDLAESQISRDVRHWRMENRATSTLSGQYLTRPSDWEATIRLKLLGSGTETLEYLNATAMDERRANSDDVGGIPRYYRHVEDQFEVWPSPNGDASAELVYYQKIPALTDTLTSNWLLDNAPDVYLYGSLIHSAPYLTDDSRLTVWAQLYSAGVQRLNLESETAKSSGQGLRSRRRGLDTGSSSVRWRWNR